MPSENWKTEVDKFSFKKWFLIWWCLYFIL